MLASFSQGSAPKRSLGQNFLVDRRVASRMVDAMALTGDETVVEIGGGRGAVTELLAVRARRLIVVEIDRQLAALLAERFGGDDTVHIITGDVLDLSAADLGLDPRERAVVFGNIPFYASSPILIWLAERARSFRRALLTLQREVGARLTASPGEKEYGSLTVRMRYAAECRRLFTIAPGAFQPRPKVVSAFLEFTFRERPAVEVADEAFLFRVVRASFAQRRKTLRNTLALLPQVGPPLLERVEARTGIDLARRGETLSLEEFASLAMALGSAQCRA